MTSTSTAPVVGSVVWQRVDPMANHQPVGGYVVEDYVDEDGQQMVVALWFRKEAGKVRPLIHRIPVGELAETNPPDRYTSAKAYRALFAALGQRQTPSGPPLEENELRWLNWAEALRRAGGDTL